MERRPLLFVRTPTYAIEVPPAQYIEEIITDITEEQLEEAVIVQPLIAHQLRFFARPEAKNRLLHIILKNGERLIGTIEAIEGTNVIMHIFEQKTIICANDIVSIYASTTK